MNAIEMAKLASNILEHVIPEYNPVEDEGSVESVLESVIARSKLALFHTNALITEIQNAERMAKIEVLEGKISILREVIEHGDNLGYLAYIHDLEREISNLKAGQ